MILLCSKTCFYFAHAIFVLASVMRVSGPKLQPAANPFLGWHLNQRHVMQRTLSCATVHSHSVGACMVRKSALAWQVTSSPPPLSKGSLGS